MGAPSIDISFIEKAISAVTRGERGIVMLWVKDMLPASAANPATVVTESDIPEGLSDVTVEQVKLAMIGYTNAPKKVLVYCMGISEDAEAAAVDTGYKKAMEAAETIRFDYLAIPTVETDGKGEDIATWVKSMRQNKKKKIKAVLPNVPADNEGIINFTTEKSVKTETVTGKDGKKTTVDTVYTAEQYCARIAGLIAGTPMTIACTYAPLPELSDCTRLTDNDTPVDKGELIIFYDGEKVKVARGVNSFVTTVDGKGDSFKKIKIVEAMDMINDDIVKTAQDSYLGKYANTYSNKCLLITAVSSYFAQLKRDDIISSYSVGLDAEAIRIYLKGKGVQATLDDGSVKNVDDCSDGEIITADTGANVFLTGNVKILDAIEDIKMPINI
ncbi:MAG: phage tail sheath subtilisin-like domain-containing protein [Roseburia sp.]|nr:phage tail sheath subtilisin-like domain-containing protein [Roseburia sp.]